MKAEWFAGIGLAGVAILQLVTLRQNRRLQELMIDEKAQQASLEEAVQALTTEVGTTITAFQNLSVALQTAQNQLNAEGSGVDLQPQIDEVTGLTQRLSAAMAPVAPVTPAPVTPTPDPTPTPASSGDSTPATGSGTDTPTTGATSDPAAGSGSTAPDSSAPDSSASGTPSA